MTDARAFRRVLITGIGGSGGSYLAEHIVQHHPEVEVHGIMRWHSTTAADNLREVRDRVTVHEADLTDFASVLSVLTRVQPDAIFHLAASANVRASFDTPGAVLANNVLGTSNLFEAVRLAQLDPVIQLCSTSEVYGRVAAHDVPITEACALAPINPYAVSKAAQDLLGHAYWASYRMRIIRTRMFAYLNPRRADLFATSFARQVAWIEAGLQDNEIVHGNLDSVRTLVDVRDAMRAYWDATALCEPGEVYNIGGTTKLTVGQFLETIIGLSTAQIRTRCDPTLLRPVDVTLQIPAVDKFINRTGWRPQVPFDVSVADLLTYWRREARLATFRAQADV